MQSGNEQSVLITGATGFIGQRVVERFVVAGWRVRALVLPTDTVPASWSDMVEVYRGDVVNISSIRPAIQGVDLVVHLAAVVSDWAPQKDYRRITIGGTHNVVGLAADLGIRTVLVSSIVFYGDQLGRAVCREDLSPGRPCGRYSASKQAQEAWCLTQVARFQLPLTIVRPANVYGPGSQPWVHDVLQQLRRRLPVLLGTGEQNAGLVYVDNVAELIFLAGTLPEAVGQVFNACDEEAVSWNQYMTDLAVSAGLTPVRRMPLWLARVLAGLCESLWRSLRLEGRPPLTREALNIVGSHHRLPMDKAKELLGYAPVVHYAEGIKKVADYVRHLELQQQLDMDQAIE